MDEAGKINIMGKSPEIILTFAISSSIIVSVSVSMGVDRPIIWLLSAVAVFMILYGIILINRTSVIITSAMLLFAGLVTLLNRELRGAVLKLYSELPEFATWVLEFSGGITAYDEKYANTLLIIIISFTVFFTMLFTLKFFNFFVVLSAGMTFFIITYINGYIVRDGCFYIFIASMLVFYILRVHRSFSVHTPNEYASRSKVFLWSLPIALLIMTVSLLLPFSSGPIKWDWMDRKFIRFMDFWDSIYQSPASFEYFSAASSGFGDGSGILGGKIKPDDTRVLSVESKYPVYLKGIAASQYSDNRWQDMKSFSKDVTGIDTILQDTTELREGLQILAGAEDLPPGIIERNVISVSFENLRTKSLFIPAKLASVDLGRYEIDLLRSPHGALSSDITLSKGFNYRLEYDHIDYNDLEFVKLLRKSRKGLYDIEIFRRWIRGNTDKTGGEPSLDSILLLKSIAGQNYQDYLQIPEDFPSRIRLLARRITAWYNDDYDKVKAIEKYLSDNYSYTLEPPPVPLGRDFVDFFLFDGKKGYCTYFATAMTMMSRTIGIPARYAEGYILTPEPADGNSERYIVTNQNAHAWPEVYFEGVGWIAFEPTPPFNPTFYTAQAISNDKVSGVSGSPFYEELMEEEELYDDLLYPGYSITPDGEEKSSNKYLLILIILALSLCLVLLLASFNIIRLRISLHIIRKSDPGKAIVKIFSYYFKLLAFAGFRLAQGETVSEYVKRLEKYVILPKESGRIPDFVNVIKIEKNETNKKSEVEKLFDVFISARYGKHSMTEKDKAYALAYLPFLTDEVKKEGRLRFYFLRFIRGTI